MTASLSKLTFFQRLRFNRCWPNWEKAAWAIANSANRREIASVRRARDQIGDIVPPAMAWAQHPFLTTIYDNAAFRRLVGLRVCQWCFDDQLASERQVTLVDYVIHIEHVIDGKSLAGTISESWIRLCHPHYLRLGGRLSGIRVGHSSVNSDMLVMTWSWKGRAADNNFPDQPIHPRLLSGGRLLDTLNPQRKTVVDVHGSIIYPTPT